VTEAAATCEGCALPREAAEREAEDRVLAREVRALVARLGELEARVTGDRRKTAIIMGAIAALPSILAELAKLVPLVSK
jgi:hypothetical protein